MSLGLNDMSSALRLLSRLTPRSVLRRSTTDGAMSHGLSWSVTVATTKDEFDEALALRASAYGRHFLHVDRNPDVADFSLGACVLIAKELGSGEVIGTMRVSCGSGRSVEMLNWHPQSDMLMASKLGEARRLAVRPSRMSTLVKLSLWKAFWLYSRARSVDALIVAARPPINEDYRMLLFEDAVPGGVWFTPPDVEDRHELLVLKLAGLESRYREYAPELYRFMVETNHNEILLPEPALRNPIAKFRNDYGVMSGAVWPVTA